jgi:glycosyltransferase 2 family protein
MKKARAARVTLTVIFIFIILYFIDFKDFYRTLVDTKYEYFFIALFLHFLTVVVNSAKWRFAIEPIHTNIPLKFLIKCSLIGHFFSLFLLGAGSGDLIRVYGLGRYAKNNALAITSVLFDRMIGLFSLFLIAAIALIFSRNLLPPLFEREILFTVYVTLTLFVLFWIIFFSKLPILKDEYIKKLSMIKSNIINKIEKVLYQIGLYRKSYGKSKKLFLKIIFFSLINHTLRIIAMYYLLGAIHFNVGVFYLAIIVPVANVLSIMPVSIQGIGINEGIYYFFLVKHGLTFSNVVSFTTLGYLIMVISGVIGAVLFVSTGMEKERNE